MILVQFFNIFAFISRFKKINPIEQNYVKGSDLAFLLLCALVFPVVGQEF